VQEGGGCAEQHTGVDTKSVLQGCTKHELSFCSITYTSAGKTPTPVPDRTPEPGDDKPQPSGAETGVTGNNEERGEEVRGWKGHRNGRC
jgi:hypothetical protein